MKNIDMTPAQYEMIIKAPGVTFVAANGVTESDSNAIVGFVTKDGLTFRIQTSATGYVAVPQQYYSVSEEVWFRSGRYDADRDFEWIMDTLNLQEALAAVRAYKGRNRLYLDLMTRQNDMVALGTVMFAGNASQIDTPEGWRVPRPEATTVEPPKTAS